MKNFLQNILKKKENNPETASKSDSEEKGNKKINSLNFQTIIISTGMSTEEEIEKCVEACNPDVIMHSNSTYPCPVEDLNLNYIKHLKEKTDPFVLLKEKFDVYRKQGAIGAGKQDARVTDQREIKVSYSNLPKDQR